MPDLTVFRYRDSNQLKTLGFSKISGIPGGSVRYQMFAAR